MTDFTRRRAAPFARGAAAAAVLAVTALLISACGVTVPSDPDGTLDAVTGGTIEVGVSPDPGLVDTREDEPRGPLVDIVEGFASSLDARVEWTVASEETLVGDLETGDLDLAVGGFTDQTPWSDRAGVTRGYTSIEGADGRSLVFLVPLGENALLSELEAFLDEEVGS